MDKHPAISQEDKDFISYLRGFAILSIIFGHVGGYWILKPASSYLHLSGSTFFFFLAGGVLYHSYQRTESIQHYYSRRFSNLLVPYYLICVIAMIFFISSQQSLPAPDVMNAISWLLIRPAHEQMPFPLGQLWFLHTYVMLIFFSPLLFYAYDKKRMWFLFLGSAFLALSVIKVFFDLHCSISLLRWDLYNLSFFGLFFMAGVGAFSNQKSTVRLAAVIVFVIALVARALLCTTEIPLDLTYSFINKDILYIIPSVMFISLVLLFKHGIYTAIKTVGVGERFLLFFHTHTFSVYLLHSLCIYLSEVILDTVEFTERTFSYGIIKFLIVLCLVALMAVPFTKLSQAVARSLNGKIKDIRLFGASRFSKSEQQ